MEIEPGTQARSVAALQTSMHRNRRRAATPINQHQGWYPRAARGSIDRALLTPPLHSPSPPIPSILRTLRSCETQRRANFSCQFIAIYQNQPRRWKRFIRGDFSVGFGKYFAFPLWFSYFSQSTYLSFSPSLLLCECIPIEFILLSRFYFTFFVLRRKIYINRTDTSI